MPFLCTTEFITAVMLSSTLLWRGTSLCIHFLMNSMGNPSGRGTLPLLIYVIPWSVSFTGRLIKLFFFLLTDGWKFQFVKEIIYSGFVARLWSLELSCISVIWAPLADRRVFYQLSLHIHTPFVSISKRTLPLLCKPDTLRWCTCRSSFCDVLCIPAVISVTKSCNLLFFLGTHIL